MLLQFNGAGHPVWICLLSTNLSGDSEVELGARKVPPAFMSLSESLVLMTME